MLDKVAKRMLSPINTAGISILGFFNLLMGLWIALPFNSLGISPGSMPEVVVGFLMLVIGTFIVAGSVKENYIALSIGSRSSFYYWFLATVSSLLLAWWNPAWIFSLMIMAYSMFVAANIKVNRKNLPFKKR